MITSGIEGISPQDDLLFIKEMNVCINDIQNTIKHTLLDKDISLNDTEYSYSQSKLYEKEIKQKMLIQGLDKLGQVLSNRFGVTISLDSTVFNNKRLTSLVMPNINYKILNVALDNVSNLFPKKRKNEVLWETIASRTEKIMYNTLSDIVRSLEEDSIEIDFKEAKISGLNKSEFIIKVDFLSSTIIRMSVEELGSLILFEVGKIFTYLEYMYTTTKTSHTLMDSFITEKYDKDKDAIESLNISIAKANKQSVKDNGVMATLEELEILMLKTYNLDNSKGSIKLEFNKAADIFVTRFGLGTTLSNAIHRQVSEGIYRNNEDHEKSGMEFIENVKIVLGIVATVMIFLILTVLGLFIFIIYVSIKLINFLLGFLIKVITKVFSGVFITGTRKDIEFRHISKRIEKIKIELIRQIRKSDNEKDKHKLALQVDEVKTILNSLKHNMMNLSSSGYVTEDITSYYSNEQLNDIIEELEENELHLYGVKFNTI